MNEVSDLLLAGLSPEQRRRVVDWWAGLGQVDRDEVAYLWDARLDSCSWAAEADDRGRLGLHVLPIRVTARLIHRDREPKEEEWRADFAEFMMGRPEVYLWEPPLRVFHIG